MCEKNKKISPFLKQCFVISSVLCSVISSCGCTMGFPGVLLPQLQQPGSSIPITEDQASWIASVEMLPMFSGLLVVPTVMERVGRRAAHILTILVTLTSWLTVMMAANYKVNMLVHSLTWQPPIRKFPYLMMLVGRILQGAAGGMMMPLRFILVSEYCSPRYRGAFISTVSLAQIIGIMLVHLLGSLLSYKMTALVSMSFPLLAIIVTVFSPETPSFLATKARYEDCRKNFMWLRSREELPELEKMIVASKLHESAKKSHFKIFYYAKREFYKPIFLMSALNIMVNFTIGTFMVVYPTPILNALMSSEANTSAWMVAVDVQNIISSIVAVYVVHKVKRRTLLFATGAFCLSFQLAIAAFAFCKTKDWVPIDANWIPGALVSAENICISVGVIPVSSVIAGEVFPLQFRSYSESISLLSLFVSVFLVLKTFPDLSSDVGVHGAFTLYSIVIAGCLAVVWWLLPETSGRTLQQIEEHFKEGRVRSDDTKHTEIETLPIHTCISVNPVRQPIQ